MADLTFSAATPTPTIGDHYDNPIVIDDNGTYATPIDLTSDIDSERIVCLKRTIDLTIADPDFELILESQAKRKAARLTELREMKQARVALRDHVDQILDELDRLDRDDDHIVSFEDCNSLVELVQKDDAELAGLWNWVNDYGIGETDE